MIKYCNIQTNTPKYSQMLPNTSKYIRKRTRYREIRPDTANECYTKTITSKPLVLRAQRASERSERSELSARSVKRIQRAATSYSGSSDMQQRATTCTCRPSQDNALPVHLSDRFQRASKSRRFLGSIFGWLVAVPPLCAVCCPLAFSS